MKRTATRHIARVRAAIAEVQASDLADRRGRSTSSKDRPSTCSARRPRCSRRSTVATRSRELRRRTGAASTRWSRPTADLTSESGLVGPRRDGRRRPPTPKRRPRSSTTSRRWRTSTVALAEGADWFREVGTDESPGTVVCTVSGCVTHAGVGEFTMGTTLREIIETRRRRRRGPGARSARCCRAPRPRSSPPTSSTRRRAGRGCRRSARGSARPRSSCSTTRPTSRRSPRACHDSSRSSRAASARRASRTAC